MTANTSQAPKAQPWKANWPAAKSVSKTGYEYLADSNGTMLVDGVCTSGNTPFFSVLACSRKETETTKAQPWKANWPPTKNISKTGYEYRVDGNDNLLIDGIDGGPPGYESAHLFSELACSLKETETTKAQPWKANWPPTKYASKIRQEYLTDEAGALLIDGLHDCSRPGHFFELALSHEDVEKE